MKLIIIFAALYLIWIVVFLSWSYFKIKRRIPQDNSIQLSKSDNIMGQARSVDRQTVPSNANQSHCEEIENKSTTFTKVTTSEYSQVVDNNELESVFSDNKIEVDFESESIEKEIEEENLSCFDDYDQLPSELGLEYSEMENLVKVVANKEIRQEKIEEAFETAYKAKNTELLDAVMSGYENGLQRVAAMLAKYETMQQVMAPKLERFEEFELTNFL